jgi:hypothetical protein
VWEPAQIVDQPVTELSSTSSPSMVFADGRWHIVYIRPGGVAIYRTRDSLGWGAAVPIADDTAAARDPKIAALATSLLVAWDDARMGHQEVWTRRHDGTEWLAQEYIALNRYGNPIAVLVKAPWLLLTVPAFYFTVAVTFLLNDLAFAAWRLFKRRRR